MKIRNIFILVFMAFSFINAQEVVLETFGVGFTNPVDIKTSGDERLFVVERQGFIKVLNTDGSVLSIPFLDIDSRVGSGGGEQGLLGLAFHPNYLSNGYFYLNYTNNSGDTVVSRFSVSGDFNIADSASEQILLTITQPYTNHNGGSLVFGSDGYLYIGNGDGGDAGDPEDRAQNGNTLLGKILRIDVDNGLPYSIPSDNPFVGNNTILDEIWAIGLRNPWKFSFDKDLGDMWIGDVGQNAIEEIDFVSNGSSGLNFGWRCFEGNSAYDLTGLNCSTVVFTNPITEYSHTSGRCSITGGYRYRGSNFPVFDGLYFFADYCTSEIGTVDAANMVTFHNSSVGNISTFGEDINGELYVAGLSDGVIYKVVDPNAIGVNEDSLNNTIRLYPNPTTNRIFIKNLNNMRVLNITFFNSLGKLMKKKMRLEIINNSIDVSSISNGLYYVKIDFENQKNEHFKIFINR